MALKIYTKTGDLGSTSLIGGVKVPKSNIRIDAYGTIDELNSFIGFLQDSLTGDLRNNLLKEIQDRLFTIGATLATAPDKRVLMKIPDLHEEDVERLEKAIDGMEELLSPMKAFVLPGGHPSVSAAHICRCVCRRAERQTVLLVENRSPVDPLVLKYLNRLSDYLFVFSRWLSHQLKAEEIIWKPRL